MQKQGQLSFYIAANFGRLSNDPAKMRKAIKEYVELVGYKKGDNQYVDRQGLPTLSQEQIAKELGEIQFKRPSKALKMFRRHNSTLRDFQLNTGQFL